MNDFLYEIEFLKNLFCLEMFGITSSLRISTGCFTFGFDLRYDSLHHFDFSFWLNLFQNLKWRKVFDNHENFDLVGILNLFTFAFVKYVAL